MMYMKISILLVKEPTGGSLNPRMWNNDTLEWIVSWRPQKRTYEPKLHFGLRNLQKKRNVIKVRLSFVTSQRTGPCIIFLFQLKEGINRIIP